MDEVEDYNSPGIFEGAAGFDGFGEDVPGVPDTVSAPPAPPIEPVTHPPPAPTGAGQPQPMPPMPQPAPPVEAPSKGYFDWWTAVDVASGAAVGYVSAKDPKDRARNVLLCSVAAGLFGSLGLGVACWWIVRDRGR